MTGLLLLLIAACPSEKGDSASRGQTLELSQADAIIRGTGTSQGVGQYATGVGDLDGDGRDDLVVPANVDTLTTEDAGAVFIFAGPLSGSLTLDDAHASLVGEAAGDEAGRSATGPGDVNGDGVPDLAVGAWGSDRGGWNAGALFVVHGPFGGEIQLSDADAILVGESIGAFLADTDPVGDLDGDGTADLLVASQFEAEEAGTAYIVLSPVEGSRSLADADAILIGEAPGDQAGSAVAGVGDIDGDGVPDLLVGARNRDRGSGAVYVVSGSTRGSRSLADADRMIAGPRPHDRLGATWGLASAGDVDADGHPDLLLGAEGAADHTGIVWLVSGRTGWPDPDLSKAQATLSGISEGDEAGASTAGPGDVDGDGFDDILVGAKYGDGRESDSGAAWLFHGPISGAHTLSAADLSLQGLHTNDMAGRCVERAGDTDADGLADFLAGAQGVDDNGENAGAVYLFRGSEL